MRLFLILEWKKNIYIKDEREIAEPEDIIKISEILSRNTFFIGSQVKNEAGEVFGRVYDLDFDTNKLYLRNLYVQKSFFGFKYGQRVFSYDAIVQVLPEYILVKDIFYSIKCFFSISLINIYSIIVSSFL